MPVLCVTLGHVVFKQIGQIYIKAGGLDLLRASEESAFTCPVTSG
jgi:hypothetical protein